MQLPVFDWDVRAYNLILGVLYFHCYASNLLRRDLVMCHALVSWRSILYLNLWMIDRRLHVISAPSKYLLRLSDVWWSKLGSSTDHPQKTSSYATPIQTSKSYTPTSGGGICRREDQTYLPRSGGSTSPSCSGGQWAWITIIYAHSWRDIDCSSM